MTAYIAGIDLGGTKIRTSVFSDTWELTHTQRLNTPNKDYPSLLDALIAQIEWIHQVTNSKSTPIGLGLPGVLNKTTNVLKTANLPANGQTISIDISTRTQVPLTLINDCKAFALSESCLGSAQSYRSVLGVSIGTGVAGGLVLDGSLLPDLNGMSGEFGHQCMPADIMERHSLPSVKCGCGQYSCYETFLTGPGFLRLAEFLTQESRSIQAWSKAYQNNEYIAVAVFNTWFDILGNLTGNLSLYYDPDCIVFGGGLSNLPNFIDQITLANSRASRLIDQNPKFILAEGSIHSGARGAALAALRDIE